MRATKTTAAHGRGGGSEKCAPGRARPYDSTTADLLDQFIDELLAGISSLEEWRAFVRGLRVFGPSSVELEREVQP